MGFIAFALTTISSDDLPMLVQCINFQFFMRS